METKWLNRFVQAAVITVALMAVCHELEKPEAEREWHDKIAGVIPYDFRPPTVERFKEAYWNPYKPVLTPQMFGIGWAINFYALLENLGVIREGASEEDFLMPSKSIKELIKQAQELEYGG